MDLKDSNIKEIMENRIVKGLFKHYLFLQKQLTSYDYSRLDVAVAELLNPNIKLVIPLNEDETYVVRKILGILDNGKTQSLYAFDNYQFKLPRSVDDHFNRGVGKLFDRITTDFKESNFNGMSSLDSFANVPNFDIYSLELNSNTTKKLNYYNIKTLRDLLSFSKEEYKFVGLSPSQIKNMSDGIHHLGLKFIDELTEGEREKLKLKTIKLHSESSYFETHNENTNEKVKTLNNINRVKNNI